MTHTGPTICLESLAKSEPRQVARAIIQLEAIFANNLDAMRIYYGWKIDAPVLDIIRARMAA